MRIAVIGSRGQVGGEVVRHLSARHEVIPLARPQVDLLDPRGVDAAIEAERPDLVVLTAAWTDVDGCARDPDQALRVNGLGTQSVALACQRHGAALLYVSTNEVFDGRASEPYLELDPVNPINAYGRSKLAGERYVQLHLDRFYIVRTAWVFGGAGRFFPEKVLDRAREHGRLQMVTDEIATPTYAPDLAQAIGRLIETQRWGIYHLTNEGVASRWDYAAEVLRHVGLADVAMTPTTLDQFPRPSSPPRYTPLRNFAAREALGITLRPWQEAIAEHMARRHALRETA